MKDLSLREKNRRTLLNMYKSIENKLHGQELIWWNSLSIKARYDFLFKWIVNKKSNKSLKFKHFLKLRKTSYHIKIENKRNAIIENILK